MEEMADLKKGKSKKVLIVSSHPLFGKGLRKLLQDRHQTDVDVVKIVASVEEAATAIEAVVPDLIIVDYDDERVNREEFLARFVEGAGRMRVVLLSLKEGGNQAVIYDRHTMAASQIDDWFEEWSFSTEATAAKEFDVIDKTKPEIRTGLRARFSKTAAGKDGRETDPRRRNMKHFLIAVGLVVLLTVALILVFSQVPLLPEAASLQAGPIDWLFNLHFLIIIFLFSLIVGFMVYSIVVFKRRAGDDGDGDHIESNTNLEVMWTLAPLAVVIYVAYLGAVVLGQVEAPDPRPLNVNVIASQWSWRFEYPESSVTSNELVLPVNQQVRLRMISTDVIHSFWVPEFRVKQDILPGGENMTRELRITPNREGEYVLRCAEMCGQLHAVMLSPVIVVSEGEFGSWLEEQAGAVPDDPVERGRLWAQQFGCLACHSTDGTTLIGPTWQDLYMHEVPLEDGRVVIADEAYLLESIVDPGAAVVAGFPNIMPDLSDQLSDEQIADIIEFIKSLSDQ
jgi:cytochrome c oxidase subunit II